MSTFAICVVVAVVGGIVGHSLGFATARRRALEAMSKAFTEVGHGPSRLGCLTLRMRWQRLFDGDAGAALAGEVELEQIQSDREERAEQEERDARKHEGT